MMADEKFYLKELGNKLDQSIVRIKKLTTIESNAQLLEELDNIVNIEKELRQHCGIGSRFKVIKTQLQNILQKYTKRIQQLQRVDQDVDKDTDVLGQDEVLVYVYLFNTKGAVLKNWENLLLPRALIDHSVNRPIYTKRQHIEEVLRTKPNKEQHAYLEIAIKKDNILHSAQNDALRDQQDFSLLRIKQGALETSKIKKFVHNDREHKVSNEGKIGD